MLPKRSLLTHPLALLLRLQDSLLLLAGTATVGLVTLVRKRGIRFALISNQPYGIRWMSTQSSSGERPGPTNIPASSRLKGDYQSNPSRPFGYSYEYAGNHLRGLDAFKTLAYNTVIKAITVHNSSKSLYQLIKKRHHQMKIVKTTKFFKPNREEQQLQQLCQNQLNYKLIYLRII